MGCIHCKQTSKSQRVKSKSDVNKNNETGPNDPQCVTAEQYPKELSSHQLLNQIKLSDTTDFSDLVSEEKPNIQSKYANSIAVLQSFWNSNVTTLSDEAYNALSLQFYTNIYDAIPEGQHLFLSRLTKDVATQSKIFFGMFGWLISTINKLDSAHVLHKMSKLGKLHQDMGVKLSYYQKMGGAFHKTMTEYFDKAYTLRVRFCFNTLYEIVVNIMMGVDFHNKCTHQKDKMAAFTEHINDVMYCLDNDDALEYLELYMKQHFCGELALFYKDYKLYKLVNNDKELMEKGKEMKKLYIDKHSEREINVSFLHKKEFCDSVSKNGYDENVFDVISKDVVALIRNGCFPEFKEEIKKVYDEVNTKDKQSLIVLADSDAMYKQSWKVLTDRASIANDNSSDNVFKFKEYANANI